MKFIGITGGVGAGKTAILQYAATHAKARILLADEVAHELMEPQGGCYTRVKALFREEDVLQADGRFDRPKLAKAMFSDEQKRAQVNAIVHPAVKEYVVQEAKKERQSGRYDFFIFEAALLIEEKYDEICDELWYIYTSETNRRKRLKENRGYSDEKISQIFQSQLNEEVYRKYCRQVIDNNGDLEDTYKQMNRLLGVGQEG
ncbi:MAG: dephospho-CoA kinase [Lachnospiraceae bacterium]